jgi:Rod binding domain-containing protein
MSTSLPPVDPTTLPADIRKSSAKTRQAYTAALGFEQMLVSQLAKAMNATAQPADGDDSGADAATTTYRDMLPDALANGIMAGGGLGLARQLVPADDTKKASS